MTPPDRRVTSWGGVTRKRTAGARATDDQRAAVRIEPSQPKAEAVLVRSGRIAHVGTSTEVKAKAADARLFDAGGRTVVPGGNARCGYEDADKGSIAVGKLADFAMLSGDPTTTPPKNLFDLKVDATILGGEIAFQR